MANTCPVVVLPTTLFVLEEEQLAWDDGIAERVISWWCKVGQ